MRNHPRYVPSLEKPVPLGKGKLANRRRVEEVVGRDDDALVHDNGRRLVRHLRGRDV